VSEFACRHLGMAPELLDPHLPEQVNTDAIYACYKASVECRQSSPTISRYFYKRYRALLLSHLKRKHREVFRNVKEIDDLNFDFLSTWNDRVKDPLNFMIDLVVPSARGLFPSRITKCIELATTPLPEVLPTPLDRSVFEHALNPVDGPVSNTVDSLERLDRLELFRTLPPEVMIEISRRLFKVLYTAGETLVWEGEENSDVFILLEGELDVIRKDQSNVGVIHPGDVFGEIAWLTKRTRVATVRASMASTCLVIKDNDLRFLCYQNPGILMAIAERTARRFSSF
jgi:hypothetical protein